MENEHEEWTDEDSRKESEHQKEFHERKWQAPGNQNEDFFTEFMFGSGRVKPSNSRQTQEPKQYPQNGVYIDYERLLNSLDSLWESTRNLRPLFNRFLPFIENFWKKK